MRTRKKSSEEWGESREIQGLMVLVREEIHVTVLNWLRESRGQSWRDRIQMPVTL